MSEPENFLSRWARRKTAAIQDQDSGEAPPTNPASGLQADETTGPTEQNSTPPAPQAEQREPEFDLSTLPPLESITSGTDITAFLRTGVPAELTRAALRRAWAADPAIRDFIGLSE